MSCPSVLYVGSDSSHRIPVMEHAGLFVVQTNCSAVLIQEALAARTVASIAFEAEPALKLEELVPAARSASTAPLVLFQNEMSDRCADLFDCVIPVLTPPEIWLQRLQEVIENSHKLREASARLRAECVETRLASQELQRNSERLRRSGLDLDSVWRNGSKGR